MQYTINVYGKKTKVSKDDRFSKKITVINGSDPRLGKRSKSARKQPLRAKLGIKKLAWSIGILIFVSWFCSTIEISYKPFNEPEKVEAQAITNVDPEKGFESADIPRDTVSRDRVESIEDKIRRVFNEEPDFAIKMAQAESSLRAEVINDNPRTGDYSVGIFQINLYKDLAKSRPSVEWLSTPENNIQYAKGLYDSCKIKTGNGWKCDWKTSWNKIK